MSSINNADMFGNKVLGTLTLKLTLKDRKWLTELSDPKGMIKIESMAEFESAFKCLHNLHYIKTNKYSECHSELIVEYVKDKFTCIMLFEGRLIVTLTIKALLSNDDFTLNTTKLEIEHVKNSTNLFQYSMPFLLLHSLLTKYPKSIHYGGDSLRTKTV